jgi:hypothetical protein
MALNWQGAAAAAIGAVAVGTTAAIVQAQRGKGVTGNTVLVFAALGGILGAAVGPTKNA